MKQNLDNNPWEMKTLFCDFLNYISYYVYLLYKAFKQIVFVVCIAKWQNVLHMMLFCTNYNRGMG